MTSRPDSLSNEAIAVFAFAIFHQLDSGEPVSHVVLDDGAGHKANENAVKELVERGLATTDGSRLAFSAEAERIKDELIAAMKSHF
ncbi:hypothetical protein [Microvirga rosea]|uniref:hypothetical protein n=1 Tax=Microvirga rosea TaxID=2715425 RepID=UPI001D0B2AFC|nr:hypothetical protein [Microvirga rosea]MCB8821798.1 hypothetical protein [Microvirga rosea]